MYQKSEVSVLPYFGQSTRIFPSWYKADKLILSMKPDNKKVYQRSPIFIWTQMMLVKDSHLSIQYPGKNKNTHKEKLSLLFLKHRKGV